MASIFTENEYSYEFVNQEFNLLILLAAIAVGDKLFFNFLYAAANLYGAYQLQFTDWISLFTQDLTVDHNGQVKLFLNLCLTIWIAAGLLHIRTVLRLYPVSSQTLLERRRPFTRYSALKYLCHLCGIASLAITYYFSNQVAYKYLSHDISLDVYFWISVFAKTIGILLQGKQEKDITAFYHVTFAFCRFGFCLLWQRWVWFQSYWRASDLASLVQHSHYSGDVLHYNTPFRHGSKVHILDRSFLSHIPVLLAVLWVCSWYRGQYKAEDVAFAWNIWGAFSQK